MLKQNGQKLWKDFGKQVEAIRKAQGAAAPPAVMDKQKETKKTGPALGAKQVPMCASIGSAGAEQIRRRWNYNDG